MKVKILLVTILTGVFYITTVNSEIACNQKWVNFIINPNKENYNKVSRLSDKELCIDNKILNSLLFEASNQNEYSLRLLVQLLKYLDGGNLEDAIRTIANIQDTNILLFLKITSSTVVEKRIYNSFFEMLPLDTIDNLDKKIKLVTKRISKFESLHLQAFDKEIVEAILVMKSRKKVLLQYKRDLRETQQKTK